MENIRAAINAKEVYENGLTGKGIGIAVLDTGASMHHVIEISAMTIIPTEATYQA